MTTNVILLTTEMMEFFQAHSVKILFSIDELKESHDKHRKTKYGIPTYDIIAPKISQFKNYQPWLGTRLTVHPDTVNNLFENVVGLYDMGINQFIIGPATGIDWEDELLSEYFHHKFKIGEFYIEKLKDKEPFRMTIFEETKQEIQNKEGIWGCQAGRDSLMIADNGDIYPCSKMYGLAQKPSHWIFGNVINGFKYQTERLNLMNPCVAKRSKCYGCDYHASCTGDWLMFCKIDDIFRKYNLAFFSLLKQNKYYGFD